MSRRGRHFDTIVVGAGLSGLVAANVLADSGVRVGLFAKGGGFLHFTSGCVDVLANAPGGTIADPLRGVDALIRRAPDHPYTLAGRQHLVDGLRVFEGMMRDAGLPFAGNLNANIQLPTAIGSTRATCLVPESMAAGNVFHPSPMLLVGFRGFRDFYPPYLAANLSTMSSFDVRHLYLDDAAWRTRRHLLSIDLARDFDDAATRERIAASVRAELGDAQRVGFPAVLGLDRAAEAFQHLSDAIGRPVFEISTLPPAVAGIRIDAALRRRLLRLGTRLEVGFWAQGRLDGTRAVEIAIDSAGGATTYTASTFILATGGTGGGGIHASADGSLSESVFGLPVAGPAPRSSWYRASFLGTEPQPISTSGVAVNERLQPVLPAGTAVENVFVTASNLPHWDPVREGSGEGVALATAHKAAFEVVRALGNQLDRPFPAESEPTTAEPSPTIRLDS